MHIKKILTPLALATCLFAAGAANAQTMGLNWNPRTGDVWVDTQLADVNRYGTSYREPFINEMVRYHGAPRDLITDLLVNRRWSAGDVYYACTLAQVAGRPCRDVADQYQQNPGQGWGVIAQRLGIKPGSAEFHRLKKGFVPTYDRWSRPITLDADLKRAYPKRLKGGVHDGHVGKDKSSVKHAKTTTKGKAGAATDKSKGSAPSKAGKAEVGKDTKGKGQGNGKS